MRACGALRECARFAAFMDAVDAYIRWYNSDTIKVTLDGMSPMQYRESLRIAA